MKKLLLLFLLASACQAQIYYSVRKNTTLSSSAEVITVQQPATGSKSVLFAAAYVDCSAACNLTLERNGTPATTTALTINNINPNETAVTATAFSASNVGTGTVIGSYALSASGAIIIDLSKINFVAGSTILQNLSIRTSSITGTVNIIILLSEK